MLAGPNNLPLKWPCPVDGARLFFWSSIGAHHKLHLTYQVTLTGKQVMTKRDKFEQDILAAVQDRMTIMTEQELDALWCEQTDLLFQKQLDENLTERDGVAK